MKTRNLITLAALTATVLAGCSNDDEMAVPQLADTPITINVTVSDRADSRAGIPTGPLQEGNFGLFLYTAGTDADTEKQYNASNMIFSYGINGWSGSDPLLWKSNDAKVTYYAYYPYKEFVTTSCNAILPEVQTEENIKENDLLYARKQTVQATDGSINLTFKHMLSYLKVKLTRGTELEEDVAIQSVTLWCNAKVGYLDFNTEGFKATVQGASMPYCTTALMKGESIDDAEVYEGLVIPHTLGTDKPLVVVIKTTNNVSEEKTYKFTSDKAITFSSGKLYTLPLIVGRNRVDMGNITATTWGDAITGGDFEM